MNFHKIIETTFIKYMTQIMRILNEMVEYTTILSNFFLHMSMGKLDVSVVPFIIKLHECVIIAFLCSDISCIYIHWHWPESKLTNFYYRKNKFMIQINPYWIVSVILTKFIISSHYYSYSFFFMDILILLFVPTIPQIIYEIWLKKKNYHTSSRILSVAEIRVDSKFMQIFCSIWS